MTRTPETEEILMQKSKIKTGVVYAVKTGIYMRHRGVVVRLPLIRERDTREESRFRRADDVTTTRTGGYNSVGYLVAIALNELVIDEQLLSCAQELSVTVETMPMPSLEDFSLQRVPNMSIEVLQSRDLVGTWEAYVQEAREEQAREDAFRERQAAKHQEKEREYQETLRHTRALEDTAGVDHVSIDTDGYRPALSIDFKQYAELLARLIKAQEKS
jgi:hypothetical protein